MDDKRGNALSFCRTAMVVAGLTCLSYEAQLPLTVVAYVAVYFERFS